MTDRQTAATPDAKPTLESDTATLFASPATHPGTGPGIGPESDQDTLFAEGSAPEQATLAGQPGEPSRARTTLGRGSVTVLPEVRSEGERLIIVPRDKIRYENDKLLGRGGMGEVKLAHDHDIGRKVAVKRLLDERNPHAVARFIDEVRTVGSLEHPNIVPIHDVGVDDQGGLFFVMKYVEGETLAAIIKKLAAGDRNYHARYNIEARLDIFVGLLRALQYAHNAGLVHRDIKPENLMIGRYGEVVVMDWGVAHTIRGPEIDGDDQPRDERASGPFGLDRASNDTVDGAVVGTPKYMSPEQASGEVTELDGRSDLYSAFAVLWELLTLTPYIADGKSAMKTVLAAAEQQAPSVLHPAYQRRADQEATAVELRHFLRRGLQHDKAARHDSAEAVIHELERVRAGAFDVCCVVTYMKHNTNLLERFMDRHPNSSVVVASTCVLAFLGGVAGWMTFLLG